MRRCMQGFKYDSLQLSGLSHIWVQVAAKHRAGRGAGTTGELGCPGHLRYCSIIFCSALPTVPSEPRRSCLRHRMPPSAPISSLPHRFDGETLPAAAPATSEAVASSAARAKPGYGLSAETGNDGGVWRANWLERLLMALGLVSILSSTETLRRNVPVRSRR